jgi:DNA-binding GntR family transcriptional regulator
MTRCGLIRPGISVKRAVKVLAAEGLVEVVPGRGSFVIDHSR